MFHLIHIIIQSRFNSSEALYANNEAETNHQGGEVVPTGSKSAFQSVKSNPNAKKVYKNSVKNTSNQSISSLVTSSSSGFVSGSTSVSNSLCLSTKSNDTNTRDGSSSAKTGKYNELKNYLVINGAASGKNVFAKELGHQNTGSVSSARSIYEQASTLNVIKKN